MPNNNTLLSIEDTEENKLMYQFSPALLGSNFIPLIVILTDEPIHFEYKMWHVLTPQYNHEDDSHKALLQTLIQQLADEHECEDHVYIYGSGTGGYDALLHSIACQVNAVYATDLKEDTRINTLSTLINNKDTFPVFYLCDSSSLNTNDFIEACEKSHLRLHLDFCPDSKKEEVNKIKDVLDRFERMISS